MKLIYFIRDWRGFIKIGHTTQDPLLRLAEMQVGNPVGLELLAIMEGEHRDEQRLHKQFQHIRVRGEWFKHTDELTNFIETHAQLVEKQEPKKRGGRQAWTPTEEDVKARAETLRIKARLQEKQGVFRDRIAERTKLRKLV